MKTEKYISVLFNSLKTGTKESLYFFVKKLRPGKSDIMFYHIGVMYITDPKLVLLFSKEMYWFSCRLCEQSIMKNTSFKEKTNIKSIVKSVDEVKESVRKKYADYLLNSTWSRKSVIDLIKNQLQKKEYKNYLNSFESINIKNIEEELKSYLETNKADYDTGENDIDLFDYKGSVIINYIRENHKDNYGIVNDGFSDRLEILEKRYIEDAFINIRHNVLSNIGPWPDIVQRTSFDNSGIEDSWGW